MTLSKIIYIKPVLLGKTWGGLIYQFISGNPPWTNRGGSLSSYLGFPVHSHCQSPPIPRKNWKGRACLSFSVFISLPLPSPQAEAAGRGWEKRARKWLPSMKLEGYMQGKHRQWWYAQVTCSKAGMAAALLAMATSQRESSAAVMPWGLLEWLLPPTLDANSLPFWANHQASDKEPSILPRKACDDAHSWWGSDILFCCKPL